MKSDRTRYTDTFKTTYRNIILDIDPRKATITKGNNLSTKVAAVTLNTDLSLKAIALPKYSPILKGVIIPAENP
jgi:hypothetical protein